jgi:hypothetical protein
MGLAFGGGQTTPKGLGVAEHTAGMGWPATPISFPPPPPPFFLLISFFFSKKKKKKKKPKT